MCAIVSDARPTERAAVSSLMIAWADSGLQDALVFPVHR